MIWGHFLWQKIAPAWITQPSTREMRHARDHSSEHNYNYPKSSFSQGCWQNSVSPHFHFPRVGTIRPRHDHWGHRVPQCPEMANYAPPICFPLFLANIVLNSKLCCCVAGEHNSGFDPPENMFFMCNRGGNVQKTTFWRFWAYSGYFFPKNLLKSMGNLYLGYYQHCHALILIWNGFWVILWLGQIWKSHYFNRGGIPGLCDYVLCKPEVDFD